MLRVDEMLQALQVISVHMAKVLMIIFPLNAQRAGTSSEYKKLIQVQFSVGDLVKTKDGLLMIGIDDRTLVYMEVRKRFGIMRKLDKYYHSQVWDGHFFKRVDSFPYGGHKGYLVAQTLINRKVPYGKWRCNQNHYMDYFLLGRIRGRWLSCKYGPISDWCPLARDMVEVFRDFIGGQDFYLQDKTRKRIYPEKLEFIPPTGSSQPYPSQSDSSPTKKSSPDRGSYLSKHSDRQRVTLYDLLRKDTVRGIHEKDKYDRFYHT